MGSGHSHNQRGEEIPLKEMPKQPQPQQQQQQQPKNQQQLNVMITKEVSERWAAIARQNWEEKRDQERGGDDKVKLMKGFGSSAEEDSDEGQGGGAGGGGGDKAEVIGTGGQEGEGSLGGVAAAGDKEVTGEVERGPSGEPVLVPSEEGETEGRSGRDEAESVSGAETPKSEQGEPGPGDDIDEVKPNPNPGGPDDNLPESESMDKLASIMAGSKDHSAQSLEEDLESGSPSSPTDDEDMNNISINTEQDLQLPSLSSPAFQKATFSNTTSNSSSSGEYYQLPEYDEVNEMFGSKRSPILEDIDIGGEYVDDDDQAPLLGNLQIEEVASPRFREVRIPKAILPVVIDDGNNGEPTVSTIGAWRVKERLEEELVKNDEHWSGEMRSLTRRFEDSTMSHAEDVDRRIRELETKYPDDIVGTGGASSASGGRGPQVMEEPCSGMASQIGKCYEKNKTERLKCHELIRQFAHCTRKSVQEKFLKKV